jgi:hypothetical protein
MMPFGISGSATFVRDNNYEAEHKPPLTEEAKWTRPGNEDASYRACEPNLLGLTCDIHCVLTTRHDNATVTFDSKHTRTIMSQLAEVVNALLSPSPLGLVISIALVLTIPLFLHFFVFRASGLTTLPSILLIGPSGSGKTSLLTLVSRVEPHLKLKTDLFAV